MTEAERAQLFALRAIVDSLLMGGGAAVPEPPCTHPEVEVGPESTLGNPQYVCARCHETVGQA